jgi:hypothetical protein
MFFVSGGYTMKKLGFTALVLSAGLVIAACANNGLSGGDDGDGTDGDSVNTGDLSLLPSKITVLRGETQQFVEDLGKVVSWTVGGGGAGTSIDQNGLLTVSQTESAVALVVTAKDEDGKVGKVSRQSDCHPHKRDYQP